MQYGNVALLTIRLSDVAKFITLTPLPLLILYKLILKCWYENVFSLNLCTEILWYLVRKLMKHYIFTNAILYNILTWSMHIQNNITPTTS